MTVFCSKKCNLAIKAVLFLSIQPKDVLFNAETIATELDIPKEFTSKILQTLTKYDIIGSKKGKEGGFYLAKDAESIRIIDIIAAIDGLDAFGQCVLGFQCNSSTAPCPLHETWGELRYNAYLMFSDQTLAQLKDKTISTIASIKK